MNVIKILEQVINNKYTYRYLVLKQNNKKIITITSGTYTSHVYMEGTYELHVPVHVHVAERSDV